MTTSTYKYSDIFFFINFNIPINKFIEGKNNLSSNVEIAKSVFGKNNLESSIFPNRSVSGVNNKFSPVSPIFVGNGLAKTNK